MSRSRLVVVTGASSGIGEAIARKFHQEGDRVLLVARREERLKQINRELNSQRKDSCQYFVCDLSRALLPESDIEALVQKLQSMQVDVLVNNAGRGSFGMFEEIPLADEQSMVLLNVHATMMLAHAVIPQMKQRRSGAIISISSIAGFQPLPFMASYAATKAFNYTHSLSLRYELAEFGVRVLTVCPGPIETEFAGVARVPGTFTGGPRDTVEVVAQEVYAALEKNRAVLITGPRARLLSIPQRLLPKSLTSWIVGKELRKVLKKATGR